MSIIKDVKGQRREGPGGCGSIENQRRDQKIDGPDRGAGLSVYWCPAEALLEDRGSTMESPDSSSGRIARALREEYGMVLQPLGNMQWIGVSAEEQVRIAAALFDRSR